MTNGTETVDGARYFAETQLEQEFMRHVIKYAESRGWLVYHTHIAKRSNEGWPDLAMARDGRLVFAELKREIPEGAPPSFVRKCSPTLAQERWLKELETAQRAVGAMLLVNGVDGENARESAENIIGAYLWRPTDWETIERVLE